MWPENVAGEALLTSQGLVRVNHFFFLAEAMIQIPRPPRWGRPFVCSTRVSEASHATAAGKSQRVQYQLLLTSELSKSRLEYLFILGRQCLWGTLEHCLQISEGPSQGRQLDLFSGLPGERQIDTGTVCNKGRGERPWQQLLVLQALWEALYMHHLL